MKVLLTTLNSKFSHINIALYYLKNSIKSICECEIKNYTINDSLDKIMSNILQYNSDVICFGCYIWNIEYILKLAESIKKIRPDVTIAFGGPEVSYNPTEVLNKYPFVSSVMCGEGENSIKELINDIKNNNIKKIYNTCVPPQDIPRIADDIITNYDGRVVYFETSRGCPYRCSYCLSCIDKNIKYFDIENVQEDLKKILDKDVHQIRFIDRTFNSDRKRALKLWKFMLDNRKSTTFHFEICASLIDDETLEFLKTVPKDTFQFEIGIQSTNKETLNAINRNYNFEKEKTIISNLIKYTNIKLHTDLIIGLPYETFEIFKNSFNDLYSLHPHEIQVGFLKFLKGTDIYDKKEMYDYKFNSFPPFEVLENKFISYSDISYLKNFETVFELLYNSGHFKNTVKIIEKIYNNNYFKMYSDITNYFIANDFLSRKISTDDCFNIINNIFLNNKLVNQALTYDYFLHFNGFREWQYNKYTDILKEKINEFIENYRETLFDNKRNSDIYKVYKFLILDYDFVNNKESIQTIYYTQKRELKN